MGRHSAPDDEDQDLDVSGTLTAVRAEESPAGSTPRPGGRHSRDDVSDAADEQALATAYPPTELFRPYTGVFGDAPSAPEAIDADVDVAEAHTTELPAVADTTPSTATINGAGPTAEPGTDTADLGAPVDSSVPDLSTETERPVEPEPDAVTGPVEVTEPEADAVTGPVEVTEPVVDPAGAATDDGAPATEARAPSGTRADLALLRTHPGLRARAAAAVLAPFVLYVIVLAVLGRFDRALFWVWIPIIVAGVAFGLVLDLAQRAHDRQRTDTPDSSAP